MKNQHSIIQLRPSILPRLIQFFAVPRFFFHINSAVQGSVSRGLMIATLGCISIFSANAWAQNTDQNPVETQTNNQKVKADSRTNSKTNTKKSKHKNTKNAELSAADLQARKEAEQKTELIYKILSSEIALQRGEWESAFVTLLSAAQQTRDPRLAKRATEIAMEAQEFEGALNAVQLWRELNPEAKDAGQYYLSLMVIKNNFAEIENFFQQELAQQNEDERNASLYQIQRLLARMDDKARAFLTLENITKPYLNQIASHVALSRAAYKNNDTARATAEAKAALAIDPSSNLGILTLAQSSNKNIGFAVVADYLKTYPQMQDVRLAYASMLMEDKNFTSAREQFLLLLDQQQSAKQNTSQVLYALSAIEIEQSHFTEAENYLQAYLQSLGDGGDATAAYLSLAQISFNKKDIAAADQWLSKIESNEGKNPVWFNVQIRRAQVLSAQGKFVEARQFLQHLKANNNEEQVFALQAEAQIMRDAGQSLEAFVVLQLALSEYPSSTELLYDFAMVAESLSKYPEMEAALRQLIQVSPNNSTAYNALGYSFADRNIKLSESLQLLEKANQLSPNDPYILDSLGWIKFRLSDFLEAEKFLRLSLSMRDDPAVAIHLGEVLWAQDKKSEALALFDDAKKKDANNPQLAATLVRLRISEKK